MGNQQMSLFPSDETQSATPNSSNYITPSQADLEASQERGIHLLALSEIEGAGFSSVRALYKEFAQDLSSVWAASHERLQTALSNVRVPNTSNIIRQIQQNASTLLRMARDRHMTYTKQRRTQIIFYTDSWYPPKLRDLPNPPAWIFVEGNLDVLIQPQPIVAVVGTREPTPDGLEAAKRLSVGLAHYGCTILSGLAEGIDEIAHRTAVDYSVRTIAVLGHGIEVVYPAATSYLRQKLVATGGAVVSEYLPRDSYTRDRFVQRNRIQAALSDAVGIIEGAAKSGTAHTFRFAQGVKRPIFGVRMADIYGIPQHELLVELEKRGYPIFDFRLNNDKRYFSSFLSDVMHRQISLQSTQLFMGVMKEVDRLVQEYEVKDEDLEWLVNAIAGIISFRRGE